MANLFGFDIDQAQKDREEMSPKNLTSGKYKMMVTQVEIGDHPFGGQFRVLNENEPMGPDLEIRVACTLVDDANGFKAGWKHTFFFSTMRMDKNNPTVLSQKAIIDRADLGELAVACCGAHPQSEQEMCGKQFYVTLKETTAKDGKTYTNISKIEPVESFVAQQPQTTAAEPTVEAASNASTPNWN